MKTEIYKGFFITFYPDRNVYIAAGDLWHNSREFKTLQSAKRAITAYLKQETIDYYLERI